MSNPAAPTGHTTRGVIPGLRNSASSRAILSSSPPMRPPLNGGVPRSPPTHLVGHGGGGPIDTLTSPEAPSQLSPYQAAPLHAHSSVPRAPSMPSLHTVPSTSSMSRAGSFYGGPATAAKRTPAVEVPLARKQALAAITANKTASKPSNVVVGVRSRPLNDTEVSMGDEDAWTYEPEIGVLYEKRDGPLGAQIKEHNYDFMFPPETPTVDVYEAMGVPIVTSALEGYNGTLFAYGQTGSGKTHTLMGTAEEPGMTILAIHDIFSRIESSVDTEYLVRVSYIELYQETICDLFNPDAGSLKIIDNPVTGPYVQGLTEEVVLSPERVLELMAIGEGNRHVAATNMNLRSSRSHTLFKMVIESRKLDAVSGESPAGLPSVNSSMSLIPPPAARNPGLLRSASSASFYSTPPPAASLAPQGGSVVRVATLHLIDLAGSERVSKSGAAGMQVKESGVINASLLTLGVVINKLISGEAHIPYRDSKLTRLLSTSLGGNAKTAVVVTVAPSSWNIGETRSSLQFAARAMKVVNKARVNEVADEAALLALYRKEVAQLKAALLEGRGGMIITADGEVVSAEEMLARMKHQHEDRQRSMEEQLKSQADSTAEATSQMTDLLQLSFVASHACGHIRSTPFIVDQLAEVASGRCSAAAAVRVLVNKIPGFRKRMTRLLKTQHIRALSGSPLASDILETEIGGPLSPSNTPSAGGGGGGGSRSPDSRTRSTSPAPASTAAAPSLTQKNSLAASSLEWSATGATASIVRLQSVAEEHEATGEQSYREESDEGVLAALSQPAHSGESGEGEDGVSVAASFAHGSSGGLSLGEEYAIDYFSPQSFGRQLKALFAAKETLSRAVKDQAEALVARSEEASRAVLEAGAAASALTNLEAAYNDLQGKATSAADQAASDFLTIRSLQEQVSSLRSHLADEESQHACVRRDADSLRKEAAEANLSHTAALHALEVQLEAECKAREAAESECGRSDRRVRELEHANGLLERELASQSHQTSSERDHSSSLMAEVSRLKGALDSARAQVPVLKNELESSQESVATLKTCLSSTEAELSDARRAQREGDSSLSEANRAILELRKELAQVQELHGRAQLDLARALSESAAWRSREGEVRGELESVSAAAAALRSAHEALSGDHTAATLRLRALEAELGTATRCVAETSDALAAMTAQARALEVECAARGTQLQQADAQATQLTTQLREQASTLSACHARVGQLEDAAAQAQSTLASRTAALTECRLELDGVRQRLTSTGAGLEDRSRRVADLEVELRSLMGEFSSLREHLSSETGVLSSKLAGADGQVRELSAALAAAHEVNNEYSAKLGELRMQSAGLGDELRDTQRKLREAMQDAAAKDALSDKCRQLESQLSAVRVDLLQCEDRAVTANGVNRELSRKLEAANGQVAALEVRVKALDARATTAESQLAASVSQCRLLSLQVQELSASGTQSAQGLVVVSAERDALCSQVAELEAQCAAMRTQQGETEQQLARVTLEATQLRDSLAQVCIAKEAALKRAVEGEARATELSHTLTSLRSELTLAKTSGASVATAREELSSQLLQATTAIVGLEAEVRAAHTHASEVTSQLRATKDALSSTQGEYTALVQSNSTLRSQHTALEAESATLARQLAAAALLRGRLEEELSDGSTERTAMREACAALEARVGELQQGGDRAREECFQLTSELTSLRADLKQSQSQTSAAQQTVEDVSLTLAQTKRALGEREEQLVAVRAALGAKSEHANSLQTSLAAKSEELAQAQTGLAQLREQCNASLETEYRLKEQLQHESQTREAIARTAGESSTVVEGLRATVRLEQSKGAELSSRLEHMESHSSAVRRDCDTLHAEVTSLRAQLGEARSRQAEAEGATTFLSRTVAALRVELQAQIGDTNAARDALVAAQRVASRLEDEKAAAIADAAYGAGELDATRARILQTQKENADLRAETTALRGELHSARSEASRTVRAAMQAGIHSVREEVRSVRHASLTTPGIGGFTASSSRTCVAPSRRPSLVDDRLLYGSTNTGTGLGSGSGGEGSSSTTGGHARSHFNSNNSPALSVSSRTSGRSPLGHISSSLPLTSGISGYVASATVGVGGIRALSPASSYFDFRRSPSNASHRSGGHISRPLVVIEESHDASGSSASGGAGSMPHQHANGSASPRPDADNGGSGNAPAAGLTYQLYDSGVSADIPSRIAAAKLAAAADRRYYHSATAANT